MEEHGGFIEAESIEGAGTTFAIYFPCGLKKQIPGPVQIVSLLDPNNATNTFRPGIFPVAEIKQK